MAEIYKQNIEKHRSDLNQINRKYNLLGTVRLIIGLAIPILFYFFLTTYQIGFLFGSIGLLVVFLFLIRFHVNLKNQREIIKALIKVNQNEIDYLNEGQLNFGQGLEFIDPHHPYSYDLDLFGPKSIYQHLNRTETFIGSQSLADHLLTLKSIEEIKNRQEAVQELSKKLAFRQDIASYGMTRKDSKEIYEELLEWTKNEIVPIPKSMVIISYILPIFTLFFLVMLGIGHPFPWGKIATVSGVINLVLVMRLFKNVKGELLNTTKIDLVLSNYSRIIEKIEEEKFESVKLKSIQEELSEGDKKASERISKLSSIFSELENIQNPVGSILFNALIMYHIRTMADLEKWKKANNEKVAKWLGIIAEVEALNSFANFHYNNPEYAFPELNSEKKMEYEGIGHPLLSKSVRINNDLKYNDFKFIILTGSNMSGKSTFLRSLGVNLILAQAGSCICAKSANIHPMQVLVSMRVTDNINENESFFFDEVDEILRGTNSNDKRDGTIGVIKKIVQKDVFGAIATHDLKVCDISKDHPGVLTNKNFEVEIQNNELHFDYTLRDGVCKNKSATFLMEKMEII